MHLTRERRESEAAAAAAANDDTWDCIAGRDEEDEDKQPKS